MPFNPQTHHRRSVRLNTYDYAQEGAYFVTICTWQREWLFGEIVDGVTQLNDYGRIIEVEWLQTAILRQNVELDAFVVMPNHLHGILVITDVQPPQVIDKSHGVGAQRAAPLQMSTSNSTLKVTPKSSGAIVRGFKSAVTRQINILRDTPAAPVWQRNYYDQIIRNETMLNNIRQYIELNPAHWQNDSENV